MVLARTALVNTAAGNERLAKLTQEHFREELGHDSSLARARGNKLKKIWDPILEVY